jgi:DHHA2 domain
MRIAHPNDTSCGLQSRCTDTDRSAAAQLSAGMSASERSALLGTLYDKLMDQSDLCCSDLLRRYALRNCQTSTTSLQLTCSPRYRDYKEWMLSGVHVGISSIGVSIADMLARDGTDSLQLALHSWAASRSVDLLVVMTGHSNGPEGYARDLGLWAATPVAKGMLSALVRTIA